HFGWIEDAEFLSYKLELAFLHAELDLLDSTIIRRHMQNNLIRPLEFTLLLRRPEPLDQEHEIFVVEKWIGFAEIQTAPPSSAINVTLNSDTTGFSLTIS